MPAPYEAELRARFGPDIDIAAEGDEIPENSFLRQVLTRRTHRRFTDRPVSDALLSTLVAAAVSASSKSDFQQVSLIRVRDPARRARLAALFPAMPWIGTAPVFIVVCGDARRLERLGALRGHALDNGHFEALFNATVDAALALQTLILAAEAVGLGTCPISVLRNRCDPVADLLALPDKVFPVAGLCLGYPAQAGFVSMRLPPAVGVHTDTYDDSGLAPAIDAYDRARDARHSLPPERQHRPDIYGTAAFYGWSEDKARQASEPDGDAFAQYLRAHGFAPRSGA